VQQVNANRVFSNLKHMLLSAVSLSGFDREQWRSELGPILKLWSHLLNANPDVLGAPPAAEAGNATPIESFVLLESNVAFKTLEAINSSLHEISEVIEGRSLLSAKAMSHAKSLMAGQVPEDWSEHWEGTEKVQPFMRLAVGKTAALRGTWLDRMASKSLLKAPVSLAQLFRPQNFLNALRQQAARSCGVSMDALTLITSTSTALLDKYMYTTVEGLLLQGALLTDKLQEVSADSPLLCEIPAVAMAWVPDSDAAGLLGRLGHIAKIPMYTAPNREELVSEIMLPCGADASQWAISGTIVCLYNE
jgi:dynein heavy chain 2